MKIHVGRIKSAVEMAAGIAAGAVTYHLALGGKKNPGLVRTFVASSLCSAVVYPFSTSASMDWFLNETVELKDVLRGILDEGEDNESDDSVDPEDDATPDDEDDGESKNIVSRKDLLKKLKKRNRHLLNTYLSLLSVGDQIVDGDEQDELVTSIIERYNDIDEYEIRYMTTTIRQYCSGTLKASDPMFIQFLVWLLTAPNMKEFGWKRMAASTYLLRDLFAEHGLHSIGTIAIMDMLMAASILYDAGYEITAAGTILSNARKDQTQWLTRESMKRIDRKILSYADTRYADTNVYDFIACRMRADGAPVSNVVVMQCMFERCIMLMSCANRNHIEVRDVLYNSMHDDELYSHLQPEIKADAPTADIDKDDLTAVKSGDDSMVGPSSDEGVKKRRGKDDKESKK